MFDERHPFDKKFRAFWKEGESIDKEQAFVRSIYFVQFFSCFFSQSSRLVKNTRRHKQDCTAVQILHVVSF